MTKFVAVDDATALDAAEAALRGDQLLVLPTDTVYGLAALATSKVAVDRIYELKDRPPSFPLAVLVDSVEQARSLIEMPDAAERVARAFWPGPLTIVLTRRDRGGTGTGGTLGVRCPEHLFVRTLARRVGPLAVTSANRHGVPTPIAAREAASSLAGEVALVIDGGNCDGVASTVVDATAPDLVIIRQGPITEEQIRASALP
ncbi:MAG: L-threonylcarbamoyladenylate synthase [Acidimicrobiaceae bacterium]|jgi:L-threonylcarbamoyladenylate synthase